MARKPQSTLTPYPNGWYMAAFSHQLKVGDIKVVPMFGQEIVVFRTNDGVAHAVDPYCPHFGAHLGHHSTVVGNTIRCPFHGWQYEGATGKCSHIPNGDPIPKKAKLTRWTVEEVSNMILVWYHDHGASPTWRIPQLPDFDGAWSRWVEDEWTVTATIQDISENDADAAHSPVMHGFTDERPAQEYEIDGAVFTWNMEVRANLSAFGFPWDVPLKNSSKVQSRRYGLAIGWIQQDFPITKGVTMRSQTLATTTPMDDGTCSLKMIHRVRKSAMPGMTAIMLRSYSSLFHQTVNQDIEVWEHKIYMQRPTASKSDASVMKFRKWARQFYSDNPA